MWKHGNLIGIPCINQKVEQWEQHRRCGLQQIGVTFDTIAYGWEAY